MTTGATANVL